MGHPRMKMTYVDVLLSLPVDASLCGFLLAAGLPLPPDLEDAADASERLIAAVQAWPDGEGRDRLAAELVASVQLGHPQGKDAMFQVAAPRGEVLVGLATGQSDLHRSFWLYAHHRDLFEQACAVEFLETHAAQAQQHDLGLRRPPRPDPSALAAFRASVGAFYQREMACGEEVVAYLIPRAPGVHLVTVHVKDLAMLRLEFEGDRLLQHVGNPSIHLVLEYSETTGVARTLARGGAKYHQMLVAAFAEHLLGVPVAPQLIRPPTLDLSVLRLGLDVPQAIADGFSALQVKSLALLSPNGTLKLECTATASSEQRCVSELLREQFPDEDPLHRGWLVTAARLHLYYPPEPGRARAKVITVEVTRRGRLNLHKFDPALQAQLEGYLVSLGILLPDQRLTVREAPPAADGPRPEPVYED